MRFRFCGDLEAPSWLLHEITTLSEISSVRLKLLVKQVLHHMLHSSIDYAKVLKFTTPRDSEADISASEGTLAAVHFVLASAAKYDIDEETLAKEIEQLGLPRENAQAILRPYRESKAALRVKFSRDTFSVHRAIDYNCVKLPTEPDAEPAYRLALKLEHDANQTRDVDLDLPADQLPLLLHEMEQVLALMDSIEAAS
ncbi:hypothetical protein CTAYLR_007017 [Chrysophaeum taylorii]|uniref:COMM domain-containing protein n=1 Tax=Chrysophaeum taylorii TaxID=2483200 RepID=A0AAD7U7R9_9STRA|nr:hypothetical protein CTAYLR_007017 [Chrysophaeum taylorii]